MAGRGTFSLMVDGDKRTAKRLEALPDRVFRKVVRKASKKAMKPVSTAARRNVRPISRLIAKSIGTKQKTYTRNGVVVTVVGPRSGFKDEQTGHNPDNTAHLVEYGTPPHTIESKKMMSNLNNPHADAENIEVFGYTVEHPGSAPFPFMRPALEERRPATLGIYRRELAKGVELESMKLSKAK